MPTEITPFVITCPSCKVDLRIINLNLKVAEVPSRPDPYRTVHCPKCKEPSFRVTARKVDP